MSEPKTDERHYFSNGTEGRMTLVHRTTSSEGGQPMSRLMSVSYTTAQVRAGTKTETRRLGWWEDKNGRRLVNVGDTLTFCEKVMGRKKGEPLVRIRDGVVTGVHRERLCDITDEGVRAEGLTKDDADFEEWISDSPNPAEIGWPTPVAWVTWFCEAMGCRPDTEVTVITWEYLP